MNAIQTEVSDGTLVDINVGIAYFAQSDINVFLDLAAEPLVEGVDYQWNSATVIHFLTGPVPNGVTVYLRRSTEIDAMFNIYDGGAPFSRLTLDEDFRQLLFLAQEVREGVGLDGFNNSINMRGFRIVNLGDPGDPGDAVNLRTLDKVLRVPEDVPVIDPATTRANKVLGFDASGNPIAILPATGSGTELALDLANTVDPFKGITMVAGSQRVVDNIAALRALPKTGSLRVLVYGYTTPGDLGGGQYYLDPLDLASADNGGTIIVANDGGRWKYIGSPTVHTFGAKGDGTTFDGAAFTASINATGGYANMLARGYNLNNWIHSSERVFMIGKGKANNNAGFTALVGGTIIYGHWYTRCSFGKAIDFGSDCGTARGLAANVGGFVMSAPSGGTGQDLEVRGVYALCSSNTGANAVHALLFEGWNKASIRDVDVVNSYHGIVYKGRNAMISGVRGRNMGWNEVFVKSDIPAWADNVADASVQNVIVYDVQGVAANGNIECSHVYVLASTEVLTKVQVHMVHGTFGKAAVTIGGGAGAPYCTDVRVSGITADQCYVGVTAEGTNYDLAVSGVTVDNPITGQAWIFGTNTNNWSVVDVVLVLTTPNAAVYACTTGGTGSWTNFTLRSGIGTKRIPWDPANVVVGVKSGGLIIDGEGNLPISNNWTGTAGNLPRISIGPGNIVTLAGEVENVVATGNGLVALPGRAVNCKYLAFGLQGTTPTPMYLTVSGNAVTLSAPARAVGMKIDLSTITYAG